MVDQSMDWNALLHVIHPVRMHRQAPKRATVPKENTPAAKAAMQASRIMPESRALFPASRFSLISRPGPSSTGSGKRKTFSCSVAPTVA